MTVLSVNVNKLATLRNSRGKNNPDVLGWSERILGYGVAGITVHPRPDARHIRFDDVRSISRMIKKWNDTHQVEAEFNVEGYPSEDFLDLIEETLPDQATLVPDPPEAITSNAGWDLEAHEDFLEGVIAKLRSFGVRTSLFIDPAGFTQYQEACLARLKPARVELYTESFADAQGDSNEDEITTLYATVAKLVTALRIDVNAGHDLSLKNLGLLINCIPNLKEVSIGHALMCEALEFGMEATIAKYLNILGGRS